MKTERILTDIQKTVNLEILPAKNIQIRKVCSIKDLK